MILTLSIASGILIAAALIAVYFWVQEKIKDHFFHKRLNSPASELPYNPNSPMVIRFQTLAGIRGRNSLRDRFNRVRGGY
jgi:hypothetical protein